MGNAAIYTPFPPATPLIAEPKMEVEPDQRWRAIKSIIANITVPKNPTPSSSQESTPVDDTASLLLPKVVDAAEPDSPRQSGNAYGTFDFPATTATEDEHTVVPLHPSSLLTSAALTPVYLILMLLPLLPFWIFAGFLCYVAATSPLSETHITLPALAVLLPFNALGTVAIIRFALGERRRATQPTAAGDEEVAASPVSRRSSGSAASSEKKRLWRPSMQFVLHGARREGRRL